jgi:CRISPR-associated helicase Cas3
MLPLLQRKESGVAVYPTNELLRDQVRAVEKFAASEGVRTATWIPGADPSDYAAADTILAPVDGRILDRWQQITHCKSRGEALRRILDPDKPKIIFVNPDILFGILALRYHAEGLEPLARYGSVVFDEFHLYQGVELAHALALIAMARTLGFFHRLVLLSATPHPEVKELLGALFEPRLIEPANNSTSAASRVAVHSVEVTPVQLSANDPVDAILTRLTALRPRLRQLRSENPDVEYIPAVVIVNSVINAIRLEDQLVSVGFERDELGIIRGLSSREIRSTKGKLLALGTSAIEVGVDFHCDYLVFEASDSASFMQRFGRVGRHRPGKAIALVPPNVFAGMCALPDELSRTAFEDRINSWYLSADAKAWFVRTEYGVLTARCLAETFIAAVRESGVSETTENQIRARLESTFADHAERLGCSAMNARATRTFSRSADGKPTARWLKVYCQMNQFRTSLPSVKVHDFMEQGRRGEWSLAEYEADLRTLLKRASGIAWNAKLGMVTIKGIGKLRRIHASDIFDDNDCGPIFETADFDAIPKKLQVYQDDETTAVSDLMQRKNHIFAVAKKRDVESEIDWRLPVFESGQYVLAFDGAALLLLEMARRVSQLGR